MIIPLAGALRMGESLLAQRTPEGYSRPCLANVHLKMGLGLPGKRRPRVKKVERRK